MPSKKTKKVKPVIAWAEVEWCPYKASGMHNCGFKNGQILAVSLDRYGFEEHDRPCKKIKVKISPI